MSIAENIKYLRESHHMNQSEFGAIAGVTDKAVSTWESGNKTPRMGAIQKLADYFGLKKSDIIEEYDPSRSSLKGLLINDIQEILLIEAFRSADPVFQQEAMEMLRRHPKRA